MDADPLTGRERLARVGTALFGADWQRPMARTLGAYFPGGSRDHIDDRLVRRWCAGARPIPEWVISALPAILRDQARARQETGVQLEIMAKEMETDPIP